MVFLTMENRELSENRETNKGFSGERMFKSEEVGLKLGLEAYM